MKVYIPDMAGRWRIVFQVVRFADGRLGLEYVAAGIAHMPKVSRRRDVYDVAHYRLHGAWPVRLQSRRGQGAPPRQGCSVERPFFTVESLQYSVRRGRRGDDDAGGG